MLPSISLVVSEHIVNLYADRIEIIKTKIFGTEKVDYIIPITADTYIEYKTGVSATPGYLYIFEQVSLSGNAKSSVIHKIECWEKHEMSTAKNMNATVKELVKTLKFSPATQDLQKVNITADLEKLSALRDSGVLTDAEFQTAKSRILDDTVEIPATPSPSESVIADTESSTFIDGIVNTQIEESTTNSNVETPKFGNKLNQKIFELINTKTNNEYLLKLQVFINSKNESQLDTIFSSVLVASVFILIMVLNVSASLVDGVNAQGRGSHASESFICRAAMAQSMGGKRLSSVRDTGGRNKRHIQWNANSDGQVWGNFCWIKGNRVLWQMDGSHNNGKVGRVRDTKWDDYITFKTKPKKLFVNIKYVDGSSSHKWFDIPRNDQVSK